MIRIAITQAAFDAIARTMPFGSQPRFDARYGHGGPDRAPSRCWRHSAVSFAASTRSDSEPSGSSRVMIGASDAACPAAFALWALRALAVSSAVPARPRKPPSEKSAGAAPVESRAIHAAPACQPNGKLRPMLIFSRRPCARNRAQRRVQNDAKRSDHDTPSHTQRVALSRWSVRQVVGLLALLLSGWTRSRPRRKECDYKPAFSACHWPLTQTPTEPMIAIPLQHGDSVPLRREFR